MQLYVDAQYASPYAMSVFVSLVEKEIPFEVKTVDLDRSENREPAYAALSLTSRVPTLVDDEGFRLSESSAITEFLDDTRPGIPLYPSDPKQRARARQIQAWLRSDLMAIREERTTAVIFYGRRAAPLSALAESQARALFDVAEQVIPEGRATLFEHWCIADLDLALMLNRLAMHGDPIPARLVAYAQAQWRRPAVQRWVRLERPTL